MLQNVCFDKLNVFRLCKLYMHVICLCICICLCFSSKINKLQKKKVLQKQIEKQGFAFFPITMTVSLLENQKYVMDQNVQYFEYIIFSAQSVGIDMF